MGDTIRRTWEELAISLENKWQLLIMMTLYLGSGFGAPFFFLDFYLSERPRGEWQAEGEAGSGSRLPTERRAQCGTQSQDSGIMN